jgi:hypothetical protein
MASPSAGRPPKAYGQKTGTGYLPPGVSQLVGFNGKALTSAANAVGKLDKGLSEGAWTELTEAPHYIIESGNADTPFTPSWAKGVLGQFGDIVPGFRTSLQRYVANLTRSS